MRLVVPVRVKRKHHVLPVVAVPVLVLSKSLINVLPLMRSVARKSVLKRSAGLILADISVMPLPARNAATKSAARRSVIKEIAVERINAVQRRIVRRLRKEFQDSGNLLPALLRGELGKKVI